jgi:predicted amidohydrolase
MKLGMAQIRVDGGNPAHNLQRAIEAIELLKSRGAEWILLPECMDLGWSDSSAAQYAQPIPGGAYYEALRMAARKQHVFVTAGLTRSRGGKVYNSACIIDPSGNLVTIHDKIYELDIVHHLYAPGRNLSVSQTSHGLAGLMICADAFAGGLCLSQSIAYMGADFILSPSSWAVPPDHDNERAPYGGLWKESYGPVAARFGLWIAAVSNVGSLSSGPWAGHNCIGCSMIIRPDGTTLFQAPYGSHAESLTVHSLPVIARNKRGTQWDETGLRQHPSK